MIKKILYITIPVLISLLPFISCTDVGRDNPFDPKAGNSPGYPVADFTVSGGEATALQHQPGIFSASESIDPQNSDLMYRWYFKNDNQWTEWTASAVFYRTYAAAGTENVSLEIKNKSGMIDSVEKTILIVDSQPPAASFDHAPVNPSIGNVITFDASSSEDDDSMASEIKARWDFDNDGLFDTDWTVTKTATHEFDSAGNKTVRVAIMDKYGLAASTTRTINILATPTYTVTYDANGANQGDIPVDTENYGQDETVTVLNNSGTLSKSGYEFGGWNTRTDGSGATYAPGAVFTMGNTNVTLYAKWKVPVAWETGAMLVDGVCGHASVFLNDKIYIIGGSNAAYSYLNTVLTYDPQNGSLSIKASLIVPRTYHAAVIVNNKIYAFGGLSAGSTYQATIEEYNPSSNTWTLRTSIISTRGRIRLASAVYDGKIYFFGGITGSSTYPRSYVDEYDTETDTWSIKSDMPTARCGAAASVVNGKIFVMGGAVNENGVQVSSDAVEIYDPATNTWSTGESMPNARHYISSTTLNNKIYIFGGLSFSMSMYLKNMDPEVLKTVEVYDPVHDSWSLKTSMISERFLLTTVPYNEKVYAIGGSRYTDNYTGRREVQVYNPAADGETVSILSDMWSYFIQTYYDLYRLLKKFYNL